MTKAKTYKFDLSALLKSIEYKDVDYYSNLSDEEKKSISPLVIMRAMTATTNAQKIYYINELVNPFVFSLRKHEKLLMKLMTLCSVGEGKFRKNSKPLTKKTSSTPKSVEVIKQYFGYNTIRSIESLVLIPDDVIIKIAEELGRTNGEIKEIKKELKKRRK